MISVILAPVIVCPCPAAMEGAFGTGGTLLCCSAACPGQHRETRAPKLPAHLLILCHAIPLNPKCASSITHSCFICRGAGKAAGTETLRVFLTKTTLLLSLMRRQQRAAQVRSPLGMGPSLCGWWGSLRQKIFFFPSSYRGNCVCSVELLSLCWSLLQNMQMLN